MWGLRGGLAGVVALGIATAVPAVSWADADVPVLSTRLDIDATDDGPATNRLVIEPYVDVTREGYRVRPPKDKTSAPIVTRDAFCLRNPFVNDVVCNRFRTKIDVDLTDRAGSDQVYVREHRPVSELPTSSVTLVCVPREEDGDDVPEVTVSARLGDGGDRFEVLGTTACGDVDNTQVLWRPFTPIGIRIMAVDVEAGGGADTVYGFVEGDRLLGNSGSDAIIAGDGDDTVSGGSGSDDIDLGEGDDTANGDSGNDAIDGGPGDDELTGSSGDDEVLGGEGDDTVLGGSEDDTVSGDLGADSVSGGSGTDALSGGDGDDMLRADDDMTVAPTADAVDCGSGWDVAMLDAADQPTGCEAVLRHRYTDPLPAYSIDRATTREASGSVRITLRCPDETVAGCAGTMTLSTPSISALLAKRTYSLPAGQDALFFIPVAGSDLTSLTVRTEEGTGLTQRTGTTVVPVAL